MSDQIIRQDIIQIGFDTDLKELTDLTKELDDLKKDLKGGIGDDAFDDFKNEAKRTTKEVDSFAKKIKNFANTGLTKLKSGLKSIGTQLTNIAKKAGTKAFNALKKVASVSFKTLIAGIGAGVAAVVKFANMASDLEETKNKIDVAFGSGLGNFDGAAKSVMDWSKTSTTAMGLAQQTALDTAALFGDMGTSMGLTKDEAAKMSMALTQQAADLASFKNMNIEEATTALNGIFTGETESLKRLGVVMTETNLERYAQQQGIKKSLKSMTEAEKVQLRYNYVMEKTKNATGDYERTGGGFANQLRTMTENFKQLGATLGALPMKKLASGMKVVNDALAEVQSLLSDGFQEGDTDKIMNIVNGLIDKGIAAISDGFPKLLPKVLTVLETVAQGLVKAIPKIAPVLATSVVNLMFGLGKIIIDNKDELVNAAKEVVLAVIKAIYTGFTGKEMKVNALENLGKSIKKIIPIVGGLAAAFLAFKKVGAIASVVSGVFGKGGKGGAGGGKDGAGGGITTIFKDLAKTKTTTILKGMANLGIILGGFVVLSAVLLAVAPLITKIGGFTEFLKLSAILLVLGVVGTALAKFGGIAGKIQVGTVVKGLANMAIMIAGMSALFLLVGAVSLIKFDLKRVMQITLIIGVLGTIGTVLSVFAGIVGLIPVPIVALGLANMAIIIAGMSALFLLIGATSLLKFDLNRLTKIIGIIGLLGTVGAVLSVFAGIVGMIPIPIVLAGLANMALVLGGISALIVAFGALSEIKGFNEFITKGGETLAKIFNVIGKCVGSIIGGLGEGLTQSLPKIGENLSKFAASLKPMFETFSGADMSGIGTFFKAMGSFMLQMAGEKVLSFFTGGTDFAGLGTSLNEFATNSKGFFTQVATFPENGFKNAKLMFECLAGMKSLPKDGGVAGWFTGSIDYGKLASGLGKLSGENVKNFFNSVSGLKQESFDNAKSLFDCLANMKSLPKEGGVAGWFTGKLNYEKIANGLGHLGGEKVKNFFEMAGSLKATAFENVKLLFESLANIKLPKEDNWWDKNVTGKTKTLSSIATDLGDFGKKTKNFFTQVNNLKVSNLNALWKSLKSAGELTVTNLSEVFDESVSTLVSQISELPKKMGDALKKNSKGLSDGMVSMWKNAVKASVSPVNKLLDGANHILKEFGSKKKVISWEPYAKGTGGHRGGNALVNDGRGAELVQMPNGRTFIPRGRNVFMPNAPKGMKVLSAEKTARLLGKKSPTFNYANGIGNIDIWSYFDNASGLVNKIAENISYKNMSGLASNVGRGMVSTFKGAMSTWIEKLFEEEGGKSLASYVASKGVSQWRSTVIRALKMEGQYSAANVQRTLYQMQTESGGNPRAINLWDSNAKKGIPSKGLMQVIDPTFKAYARTGFNKNIYDPLSNVLASVRYAVSRYGTLAKAYRGVGYSNGVGTLDIPEQANSVNLSYTPESNYKGGKTEYNTYAPVFNFTISGTNDDRATARKVKRWVVEAWNDLIDDIDSKNPQTQRT